MFKRLPVLLFPRATFLWSRATGFLFACVTALVFLSVTVSATTTVTGNIKNLGTGPVSAGSFVRFYLRGCAGNQPRVNGSAITPAIIAPTLGNVYYFDFVPSSSGAITGTLYSTRDSTGVGKGEIECAGSQTAVWYGMQPFLNGKAGPETPVHALNGTGGSPGTLDITSVTPITANPVVTAAVGLTQLTLPGSISGLTTVQASPVASGVLTLPAVPGTDMLVGQNTTDTLTNKTLIGALLNSGATFNGGMFSGTFGAAGAPAYTFVNNSTTGLYSPSLNQLTVAVGGVNGSTFSQNGMSFGTDTQFLNFGLNRDTSLSRVSAGVVAVGNGNQGDASGTIKIGAFNISERSDRQISLQNPDFEGSTAIPPPGWVGGAGFTASYETAFPAPGKLQSLKLATTQPNAGLLSVNSFSIFPGDTYSITAMAKGDGSGTAFVGIACYDKNGTFITSFVGTFTTSTSWTQLTSSGTVPANAVKAIVILLNTSATQPSTVWFDQVSVQKSNFPGAISLGSGVVDTGLSRVAAGTVALGNGTQGDASGTLNLQNLTSPALGTANSTPTNFGSGSVTFGSSVWNGSSAISVPATLLYAPAQVTNPNLFFNVNFPSTMPSGSFFQLQNLKLATSGANVNSPTLQFIGQSWTGSASQQDTWMVQDVLGSGANPTNTLTFSRFGGSGAGAIQMPTLSFPLQTAPPNPPTGSITIYGDTTSGQITCRNASGISCLSATAAAPIISSTANPAQSGLLRAASGDTAVAFRNNANTTDIQALTKDTSDIVQVGGSPGMKSNSVAVIGPATLPTGCGGQAVFFNDNGSPNSADICFGDGTGWFLNFTKRAGSTSTSVASIKDTGIINASAGYQVGGAAASGNVLRGNGSNFVSALLGAADLSNGTTGSGAVVLQNSPVLGHPSISTGISNGSGLAIVSGSSCTTQAISANACGTTFSWGVTFADANYGAWCSLDTQLQGNGAAFVVQVANKTTTTANMIMQNAGPNASATQFTYWCLAIHP